MMQHVETICDTFGGGWQFGSASRDAGHPGVNLLLPMLYIYDAWLHALQVSHIAVVGSSALCRIPNTGNCFCKTGG